MPGVRPWRESRHPKAPSARSLTRDSTRAQTSATFKALLGAPWPPTPGPANPSLLGCGRGRCCRIGRRLLCQDRGGRGHAQQQAQRDAALGGRRCRTSGLCFCGLGGFSSRFLRLIWNAQAQISLQLTVRWMRKPEPSCPPTSKTHISKIRSTSNQKPYAVKSLCPGAKRPVKELNELASSPACRSTSCGLPGFSGFVSLGAGWGIVIKTDGRVTTSTSRWQVSVDLTTSWTSPCITYTPHIRNLSCWPTRGAGDGATLGARPGTKTRLPPISSGDGVKMVKFGSRSPSGLWLQGGELALKPVPCVFARTLPEC